jgi:hypothetical protein
MIFQLDDARDSKSMQNTFSMSAISTLLISSKGAGFELLLVELL